MYKSPRSAGGIHSLIYVLKSSLSVGVFRMVRSMLKKNTCKTCALGMGGQKGGMKNELGHFPEVCKKSIQAMKSDMQAPISSGLFKRYTMEQLGELGSQKLDALGRIPFPLYASADSKKLCKISWEEAFEKVATKLKVTDPLKSFFYFSGRSSNEAGFLLQLMARVFGTNHVNNCSYYCHQPSGVGLTKSLGGGTSTVQLEDVKDCDLFILIGANPTSNHPRLLTSLKHIRKKGATIIVINPVVEPGLVKFKIPSDPISLLFGTKIADIYIQPHIGGDQALVSGIAKYIIEQGEQNHDFINNYTQDYSNYKNNIVQLSWKDIIDQSGVCHSDIVRVAEACIKSDKTIFSWAMGITHHLNGVENVEEIVNLALLRGMVGKKGSGLLPLRGHSNVQGMGTVGVTPKLKQEVFDRLVSLGIKVPTHVGYDTMAAMEAAMDDKIDLAFCLGGNLYASNPDLAFASKAMNKIGMMVYLNTTLNEGHFYAQGKETLIFPVLARNEEAQATTQESMFSYIRLSEGGDSSPKELKSEVEIISSIASLVFGNGQINWAEMKDFSNIRNLISKCIPGLERLEDLDKTKNEFTISNRILHRPVFNTPSKKAKFHLNKLPPVKKQGDNILSLMTVRSEGQYNTVIFEQEDRWRGIKSRDVILLNSKDMENLNLVEDQHVSIQSKTGRMDKIKVKCYSIRQGNALMYYPEVNILVPRSLDSQAKTPAYKNIPIQIIS